jgi:hypothetical protein
LIEEVASYDSTGEQNVININTDARHGQRKNSKDTSMPVLGENTHKVLYQAHIQKQQDHVTQRHETIGTKEIYSHLHKKGVTVGVHTHDRNMAVNKLVREAGSKNQNDHWHGIKALKKAITNISSGAKKNHGITWHNELEDKVEPIANHAHWAIQNCDGDPQKLRQHLLNCIDHYKNIHTNCSPKSRCQTDLNYESSRIKITTQKAEELLTRIIKKSTLFMGAADFVLGRSTAHVESFNNTMNMFHDKRIYYKDREYDVRSKTAVLHWNDNAGREHTSVWTPKSQSTARRQKNRKTYKQPTFKYRNQIWNEYIKRIYEK